MKKITLLSFCLILALLFSASFSAFAASEAAELDPSVDMSDTALDSSNRANFHKQVADDPAFINLVVLAAEKKEKDVSLEGVHPDKCIKLYGFKRSEKSLIQSLYDTYMATGKIESVMSDDYGVLVLYDNKDGEYVDSLTFTRKENLPGAQDKNGWVPLGSGSLTADDDFLAQYSNEGNLKKYVKGLGLKNTNHLRVTTAIPYMPACIYFVQKNEEFLLPLEDGRAGIKCSQVYKVSDIVENYLKSILDYQNELEESYREQGITEVQYGAPLLPDKLPIQAAVDLNTYFDTKQETAALNTQQTTAVATLTTPETTADTFPWVPVILSSAVVLLLTGGIVFVIRKKRRTVK